MLPIQTTLQYNSDLSVLKLNRPLNISNIMLKWKLPALIIIRHWNIVCDLIINRFLGFKFVFHRKVKYRCTFLTAYDTDILFLLLFKIWKFIIYIKYIYWVKYVNLMWTLYWKAKVVQWPYPRTLRVTTILIS